MRVQIKQLSFVFVLVMMFFALSIFSSAQPTGRAESAARKSRIIRLPVIGRKVAEELNPQPLPPCEKCAGVPTIMAHGDPARGARLRPLAPVH